MLLPPTLALSPLSVETSRASLGFLTALHSVLPEILLNMCVHAKSLQLCPPVCGPMDYSLSGSSVQEILQARIVVWVAILSSRRSS